MAETLRYRSKLYQDYNKHWGKFQSLEEVRAYIDKQRPQLEGELLPLMPQDSKAAIVDLGCGYGPLVAMLKQHGYANIRGIDISPDQVRTARQLGLDEVEQGDAGAFLRLAENKEAFDVICAIDIIEHLTKDELVDFLECVRAALKPGGYAIMRTPNVDAPFGTAYTFGDFTHECALNKFSALELFQSLGFSHVEVLPGKVLTTNPPLLEFTRKLLWHLVKFASRVILFATGISARNVVLTPNLVIRAGK